MPAQAVAARWIEIDDRWCDEFVDVAWPGDRWRTPPVLGVVAGFAQSGAVVGTVDVVVVPDRRRTPAGPVADVDQPGKADNEADVDPVQFGNTARADLPRASGGDVGVPLDVRGSVAGLIKMASEH